MMRHTEALCSGECVLVLVHGVLMAASDTRSKLEHFFRDLTESEPLAALVLGRIQPQAWPLDAP